MRSSMLCAAGFWLRTFASLDISAGSCRTALTRMVALLRVCLAIIFTAAIAIGQSYYGGLRGVVRDPDGSVIANTKVTLIDQATRVERFTYSTDQGAYYFNQVVPAT